MSTVTLYEGYKIGTYRIVKLISRGAYGAVYKGFDTLSLQEVAVKVVRRENYQIYSKPSLHKVRSRKRYCERRL